ncbi:MAG: hypothetical protein HQL88_02050 [Magnetococcales bacterium]|nr:hypothetical protein [Magnetococcales bacterium]
MSRWCFFLQRIVRWSWRRRPLCTLLGCCCLAMPFRAAQAEFIRFEDEQQTARTLYQTCLLKHVQPAQSQIAAAWLQQACQRQFAPEPVTAATGSLSGVNTQQNQRDEHKTLDECLLHHLPTVQNDTSASTLVQMCKEHSGHTGNETENRVKPSALLHLLGIDDRKPRAEQSQQSLEGDVFVPLRPWQAGQSR